RAQGPPPTGTGLQLQNQIRPGPRSLFDPLSQGPPRSANFDSLSGVESSSGLFPPGINSSEGGSSGDMLPHGFRGDHMTSQGQPGRFPPPPRGFGPPGETIPRGPAANLMPRTQGDRGPLGGPGGFPPHGDNMAPRGFAGPRGFPPQRFQGQFEED